jgi:hypothetical protein
MEDSEILILILWIVFAIVVAAFAHKRGRSSTAWLLVGLLVSPLIAFIAVAVMEPGTEGSVLHRTCPFCAERIKAEAKVCRYCGREAPATQHQDRVQDRSEPAVLPFPKLAVTFLVVLACLIGLGILSFTVHASGQTFLGI